MERNQGVKLNRVSRAESGLQKLKVLGVGGCVRTTNVSGVRSLQRSLGSGKHKNSPFVRFRIKIGADACNFLQASEIQVLVCEACFHNFLESCQIFLSHDFSQGIQISGGYAAINLKNQLRDRPKALQIWLLSQRSIQIAG